MITDRKDETDIRGYVCTVASYPYLDSPALKFLDEMYTHEAHRI